ncbi:hypothetical protein KA082_00040 [Candidatus Woesebacteria bacterium]|nr:hypothetical protein [Candidatus Woesebacteria bacterium]
MKISFDTLSIIISNVIPLYGVIFLGWKIDAILFIYWCETVIIGFYTILKIFFANFLTAESRSWIISKINITLFFLIHFGGFSVMHGVAILALIGYFNALQYTEIPAFILSLSIPILSIFISHGISFIKNYIIGGESKKAIIQDVMSYPYERIFLTQIIIIIGGFIYFSFLHSYIVYLVLLIISKIILDIQSHTRLHKKAGSSSYSASAQNLTLIGKWSSIVAFPPLLIVTALCLWIYFAIIYQTVINPHVFDEVNQEKIQYATYTNATNDYSYAYDDSKWILEEIHNDSQVQTILKSRDHETVFLSFFVDTLDKNCSMAEAIGTDPDIQKAYITIGNIKESEAFLLDMPGSQFSTTYFYIKVKNGCLTIIDQRDRNIYFNEEFITLYKNIKISI